MLNEKWTRMSKLSAKYLQHPNIYVVYLKFSKCFRRELCWVESRRKKENVVLVIMKKKSRKKKPENGLYTEKSHSISIFNRFTAVANKTKKNLITSDWTCSPFTCQRCSLITIGYTTFIILYAVWFCSWILHQISVSVTESFIVPVQWHLSVVFPPSVAPFRQTKIPALIVVMCPNLWMSLM